MNCKFIPLGYLVHALDNTNRLYYLYHRAALSGDRGAMLRFQMFVGRLDKRRVSELRKIFN